MSGIAKYIGRALDCGRCADTSSPPSPCSCLVQCGAERCTGRDVPVIDRPTRHVVRNRPEEKK